MAETTEQFIIFDVEFNSDKAKKGVIDLEKQLFNLRKQQKELTKNFKQGLISEDEFIKKNLEFKDGIKEASLNQKQLTREIQLNTQAINANSNSYEQLNASLALEERNLKKIADTLETTIDGEIKLNNAFKEQFNRVEKLKNAQITFNKEIKNGTANVGNYSNDLEDAIKNLSGFEIAGGGALDSLNNVKTGFISLGKVILANPIFLIASVLIGLASAFASTEEGGNRLSAIFAGLKKVIEPAIETVLVAGEGLFFLLEVITSFITAIGDFFGTGASQAVIFTKSLQAIDKQLISLQSETAKLRQEEEELKNIRDKETLSFKDRIKANEDLGRTISKQIEGELKAQKEKLAILEKQVQALPKQFQTTKILKELEDQRTLVAEQQADILGRQNEQITNQVSLSRELRDAQNEILELRLNEAIATGEIIEGTQKELDARLKLNEAIRRNSLLSLLNQDQLLEAQKLSTDELVKQLTLQDSQNQLLIEETKQEQTLQGILSNQLEIEKEKNKTSVNGLEIAKIEATANIANAQARESFEDAQRKQFEDFTKKRQKQNEETEQRIQNAKIATAKIELLQLQTQENTLEQSTEKRIEFAEKLAQARINLLDIEEKVKLEKLGISENLLNGIRQKNLNEQQKNRLETLNLTEQQINLILLENSKKRSDIIEQTASDNAKAIETEFKKALDLDLSVIELNLAKETANELEEIEALLKQGLISFEDFEKEKTRIQNEQEKKRLESFIENLQTQLETLDLTTEQKLDIETKLANAQTKLNETTTKEAIENKNIETKNFIDKAFERLGIEGEIAQKLKEIASELSNFTLNLINQGFENRINDLERQKALEKERLDSELKTLEGNQIAQDRARQKSLANQLEIDRKLKQEQIKQFRFEKALNISKAIANTALQVTRVLANPILAVAVGALGAVQIASIIAQNPPEFQKGGFTARGKDSDFAGVVHKNEYVVPASIVRSPQFAPTIATLENARVNGFQGGGFTSTQEAFNIPQNFNSLSELSQGIDSIIAPIPKIVDNSILEEMIRKIDNVKPVLVLQDFEDAIERVEIQENLTTF